VATEAISAKGKSLTSASLSRFRAAVAAVAPVVAAAAAVSAATRSWALARLAHHEPAGGAHPPARIA
jgi:hypothetical protein